MKPGKGEAGKEKGETPAAVLERVFKHIADTRMAGLPILNPALRVQAVGFRAWQGRWVGVLITPWTISLVLLAGDGAPLEELAPDTKMDWEFPSGRYEFMGLHEPALGGCQTCSLISPVSDIVRHEDAVSIAGEVMEALFSPVQAERQRDVARIAAVEAARLNGAPVMKQELSRRDFLRGKFLGT
jgi:[NiFe] hydrogenase assembly HybE family chaperone